FLLNAYLEEELVRRTRRQHEDPASADEPPLAPLILLTRHVPRHHHRLRALLQAGRHLGLGAIVLTDASPSPADMLSYHIGANGRATKNNARDEEPLRFFHLPTSSAEVLLRLIRDKDDLHSAKAPPVEEGSSSPVVPGEISPSISVAVGKSLRPIENCTSIEDDGSEFLSHESGSEAAREESGNIEEAVPSEADAAQEPEDPPARPQTVEAVDPEHAARAAVAPRPVTVGLLGPLTVNVRGQLITRGLTGYSGELLAYLASRPSGSARDAVLDAIWPEKDPTTSGIEAFNTAKKSVRNALRTELGTTSVNVFLHGSGLWRLDPALIKVDLEDFHAAVRSAGAASEPTERLAAHRRVIELYHGELCEGMDHPWLVAMREETRRSVLNALGALASSAVDPEETLGLLERSLEHDPYNEQLHLRLARQHTALGRTEAVRRTQERLRRRLAEIDERPTSTTTRAFQELLNPYPAPARVVPSRPAARRPNLAPRSLPSRP
ncbi:hypothetical protein C7C46_31425, partial [Streptomyces tateyamensis]